MPVALNVIVLPDFVSLDVSADQFVVPLVAFNVETVGISAVELPCHLPPDKAFNHCEFPHAIWTSCVSLPFLRMIQKSPSLFESISLT